MQDASNPFFLRRSVVKTGVGASLAGDALSSVASSAIEAAPNRGEPLVFWRSPSRKLVNYHLLRLCDEQAFFSPPAQFELGARPASNSLL